MLNNFIKICKVFPYTEDDADLLYKNYSNSAVDIIEDNVELGVLPSIIIGWERVKKLFPSQSIMNKKIDDNVFWTYSIVENKEEFKKDVDFFIKSSIKNYFSKSIKTYDAIIDGDLKQFFSDNINPKTRTFIYFHKNALYFHNEGRNCAISLISL